MAAAKPKRSGEAGIHSRPPLQRMQQIHAAIKAGKYPNSHTLARELEVSVKSVKRDIAFMRDRIGFPLAYDPVRFGYHYTGETGDFPAFQITEGELFALLVAEKAIEQYRGTAFERRLVSAFKKISAGLPDKVSMNLADWDDSISFRTSAVPIFNMEVFNAIAHAVAKSRQLDIRYKKPGGAEEETRTVDPYHLANVNGEWFLFAHDHLRRDIRTFVPGRIREAVQTGKRFKRPADFSHEKLLSGSFGVVSGSGSETVVVQFSPPVADYIREKQWHPTQELRELEDGGVELSVVISSMVEIHRWILSWGGNAKVISPEALVSMVRESSGRAHKAHGGA